MRRGAFKPQRRLQDGGLEGIVERQDALRTTTVHREVFRPQRRLQASVTTVHHCMSLSSTISMKAGYLGSVRHYLTTLIDQLSS